MVQSLAVRRLVPFLFVWASLYFLQDDHPAAEGHNAGSTTNGGSQSINELPNPIRSAPLVLEHVTVITGNGSPAIRDATCPSATAAL